MLYIGAIALLFVKTLIDFIIENKIPIERGNLREYSCRHKTKKKVISSESNFRFFEQLIIVENVDELFQHCPANIVNVCHWKAYIRKLISTTHFTKQRPKYLPRITIITLGRSFKILLCSFRSLKREVAKHKLSLT